MINTGWAFKPNGNELCEENLAIHKKLAPKAKLIWLNFYTKKYDVTQDDL